MHQLPIPLWLNLILSIQPLGTSGLSYLPSQPILSDRKNASAQGRKPGTERGAILQPQRTSWVGQGVMARAATVSSKVGTGGNFKSRQ